MRQLRFTFKSPRANAISQVLQRSEKRQEVNLPRTSKARADHFKCLTWSGAAPDSVIGTDQVYTLTPAHVFRGYWNDNPDYSESLSMSSPVTTTVERPPSALLKEAGDISSVFPSLSGKASEPLAARFSDVKKQLIKGHEDAVTESWHRLLASLKEEIVEVKKEGSKIIPTVEYANIAGGRVSQSTVDAIRHRGVAVIRNVLPQPEAIELKMSAQEYIAANKPKVKAFPPDDPAVYELYWTPTQTTARAHSNVLQTQTFLGSLWHSSDPQSQISTTYPLTYADRFRIRRPGDGKFALGPHSDGGSLERWEDEEYSRVYHAIFTGNWEEYDPFDAHHRIAASMDLYNGGGSCSTFRLFQGWLSMSSTGPGEGTLRVNPMLKQVTAYVLLKPFFDSHNRLNLDSTFPGSVPGACQEYAPTWHPDLELDTTMVSVPRVEPGDFVAWHCDTMHAVDQVHNGSNDSSVLYIPACAVTPGNIEFMTKQRIAALAYSPPPDFPGAGGAGEFGFTGSVDWNASSKDGLRAMGLGTLTWEVTPDMSEGEKAVLEMGNKILFSDLR